MKYTYTEEESVIIRSDENGQTWHIPKDPANSDYQRYLNPDADESGTL